MKVNLILWNAAGTLILVKQEIVKRFFYAEVGDVREFHYRGAMLNMLVQGTLSKIHISPDGEGGYGLHVEYISTTI